MHLDVLDLRNFYYRTQLGRVAQRAIRDQVVRLWAPKAGETVAGFGFAVPLLRPYLAEARRVVGLMPGPQGVMPWPAGMANVSVLCEDSAWPLPTGLVDRLVLMHGLETSENPSLVLEESHRVLGPGGRALFIVPNRPLVAPGRHTFRFWAALFGRAAGDAAETAWLHAGTELLGPVRAPSGHTVLAAVGELLGARRAADALAGGRGPDGRGVKAGLRADEGRSGGGG
jgi:SAM-dependent methyltransferase